MSFSRKTLLPLAGMLAFVVAPAAAQSDDAVIRHVEEVEWVEIVPGIRFAAEAGDWQSQAHAKLVKFDAGAATPLHTHTHPYHGVVISGTVTNPFDGEADPPELEAGDYWYVPGGAQHVTACVSEEPCLFYTHADHPFDLNVVVEEPGESR